MMLFAFPQPGPPLAPDSSARARSFNMGPRVTPSNPAPPARNTSRTSEMKMFVAQVLATLSPNDPHLFDSEIFDLFGLPGIGIMPVRIVSVGHSCSTRNRRTQNNLLHREGL